MLTIKETVANKISEINAEAVAAPVWEDSESEAHMHVLVNNPMMHAVRPKVTALQISTHLVELDQMQASCLLAFLDPNC